MNCYFKINIITLLNFYSWADLYQTKALAGRSASYDFRMVMMWAADAVWGEVLSEQNNAVCSFLSDFFLLGENTLPAWAAFLLFTPRHGMLHVFLMHYVPDSGHETWAWGLIKNNSVDNLHPRDGQLLELLGWNPSQPKLVQLQSTAEVSAVPKRAESHSILCCFWAAAFRHLCSALGSVSGPVWFMFAWVCLCPACTQVMFALQKSYLEFLEGN